jgi:undecaprenyl-diphosphatase
VGDVVNAVLLGLLEGLTEFLPVSSTGHLILAGRLLGFEGEASKTFKIVIQLGAILAVLVVYRQRFWDVLKGLGNRDAGAVAFTRNIALGFLPAAVVGLFIYSMVKAMMETPAIVAWALIVGGIAILIIERSVRVPRFESVEAISWRIALGIGIVQCVAMVPGVSRSGATIMGALLMGVERRTAAEFSFFVAVPTMIAAAAYDLYKSWDLLSVDDFGIILIGFAVSFVVAALVVKAFVALVSRYGFKPFAWYRIVIGIVALVWMAN